MFWANGIPTARLYNYFKYEPHKSIFKLLLVGVVLVGPAAEAVSQRQAQSSNTAHFMSMMTTDPTLNSSDSIEQKPTPTSKPTNLTSRVVVEGAYAFNEALKYHP